MNEQQFVYDKPVSGKDILGRQAEIEAIVSTLSQPEGKNVVVYGPPESGKKSVIGQAINILIDKKLNYVTCRIDLFNIRTAEAFVSLFKSKMSEMYKEINRDSILPFDIEIDKIPPKRILDLPEIMAQESGRGILVYFTEFQNVLTFEDNGFGITAMDRAWSRHHGARYIFSGSFVNMMKYMFLEKKYMYDTVSTVCMMPLPKKTVVDYITLSLLNLGRVIESEQAGEIYSITGGSIFYVNQMCATFASMPIGYVNHKIVSRAKDILLSVYVSRYRQTMLDLTPNQINFLKAVIAEVGKFSSSKILEEYHLNSSANVFRIKDALKKKEVITFDQDDTAYILDPLFKYWLSEYYFIQ